MTETLMNESNPIQIVQDAYAAFGRGDVPGVLALLSADVVWDHPQPDAIPWGGTRRGHAEVTGFFQALGGAVDVLAFEPRQFVAQGDTVVVLGSERMRVRATGREYHTAWAHTFTIRGGKISAFAEHTDTAAIIAALRSGG